MITAGTVEELMAGSLRPKRVYDKEWRTSSCGRTLTNTKNEDKVVFVTPNSVVITTDMGVRVVAKELGAVVFYAAELNRKYLTKELERIPSTGLKRAVRWAIGR